MIHANFTLHNKVLACLVEIFEHDIDRTESGKPQGASRNQYSDGRNVLRWF